MENWLFVDMQTLGLDPNCAVLSIGMLYVTEDMKEYSEAELMDRGLYMCLDVEKQRRPIDKDTLAYWKYQPKEDMKPFYGRKVDIDEAYNKINIYLQHDTSFSKNDSVWSKGMIDKWFYQSLFKKYNPLNIQHYQWRDSSTALEVLTGNVNGTIKNDAFKIKNHALYNCVMEYKRMREALKLYE